MQKDNMEYFLCKVKEHYCINLNDISEEEREDYIVELARQGDCYAIEYIFERYRRFVYSKAKDYFLVGADKEDLIQEGMIGLHKAIRDFDREKKCAVSTFCGFVYRTSTHYRRKRKYKAKAYPVEFLRLFK